MDRNGDCMYLVNLDVKSEALTSESLKEGGMVVKNIVTAGKIARRMMLLLSSMRFVRTFMSLVLSTSANPNC